MFPRTRLCGYIDWFVIREENTMNKQNKNFAKKHKLVFGFLIGGVAACTLVICFALPVFNSINSLKPCSSVDSASQDSHFVAESSVQDNQDTQDTQYTVQSQGFIQNTINTIVSIFTNTNNTSQPTYNNYNSYVNDNNITDPAQQNKDENLVYIGPDEDDTETVSLCRSNRFSNQTENDGVYYWYDAANKTLHFASETKKTSSYSPVTYTQVNQPIWFAEANLKMTKVVIEDAIQPTKTRAWFGTTTSEGIARSSFITEIEGLNNLDMSKVEDSSWMFTRVADSEKQAALRSTIQNWTPSFSRLVTADAMFACSVCPTKTNGADVIQVPALQSAKYMFQWCCGVNNSISISNVVDGSQPVLTNTAYMFAGNTSEKITLDLKFVSEPESARSMFNSASNVEEIELSNFYPVTKGLESDTVLTNMFRAAESLESVFVPSKANWTASCKKNNIFKDANKLKGSNGTTKESLNADAYDAYARVDMPKGFGHTDPYLGLLKTHNCTKAYYTKSFASLTFANSHDSYVEDEVNSEEYDVFAIDGETDFAGGIPWATYQGMESKIKFVYTEESMLEEGAALNVSSTAFWCAGLENAEIIDVGNLNTKYATSMAGMFQNCSSLTTNPPIVAIEEWGEETHTVTYWDTSNVKNMSRMFDGCESMLINPNGTGWDDGPLFIDKWNTSNVTDMSYMFNNCQKTVYPPSVATTTDGTNTYWDTSNVVDMNEMFEYCSSLTDTPPDVSKWNTSNVTDMSYMFNDCSGLTEAPAVSSWNTSKVENMSALFNGCSSLKIIDISGFTFTSSTQVGSDTIGAQYNKRGMFSNCANLTTIYYNSDLTSTLSQAKSYYAFYGSSNLPNYSSFTSDSGKDSSGFKPKSSGGIFTVKS